MADVLDLTANYYDVLGLRPEDLFGKEEADIAKTITQHYRAKALRLHPDKGGKKEDFQRLQEAYLALKNQKRRKEYNEILEKQVSAKLVPSPTASVLDQQVFQALTDLENIMDEFNLFASSRLDGKAMEEAGFQARYARDPHTQQQMLILTFPNQAVADAFIKQMIEKGLIRAHQPAEVAEQTPKRLTPFASPNQIPRLTMN